jgi:hypothetical protein
MRYESDSDLEKEKEAAQIIHERWGLFCTKLGEIKYRVDWALSNKRGMACWGEFKYRSVKKDAFPTLILSADKWSKLVQLSGDSGLNSLLFVKWIDADLHFVSVYGALGAKLEYTVGGNAARGRDGDIEPVVHLPINWFKPVEKYNAP